MKYSREITLKKKKELRYEIGNYMKLRRECEKKKMQK